MVCMHTSTHKYLRSPSLPWCFLYPIKKLTAHTEGFEERRVQGSSKHITVWLPIAEVQPNGQLTYERRQQTSAHYPDQCFATSVIPWTSKIRCTGRLQTNEIRCNGSDIPSKALPLDLCQSTNQGLGNIDPYTVHFQLVWGQISHLSDAWISAEFQFKIQILTLKVLPFWLTSAPCWHPQDCTWRMGSNGGNTHYKDQSIPHITLYRRVKNELKTSSL